MTLLYRAACRAYSASPGAASIWVQGAALSAPVLRPPLPPPRGLPGLGLNLVRPAWGAARRWGKPPAPGADHALGADQGKTRHLGLVLCHMVDALAAPGPAARYPVGTGRWPIETRSTRIDLIVDE